MIGAGAGTMWEWYFRTSLDHWSTFLGMIFALNYPATAQWVKKIESLPFARQWAIKGSVAAVLLSATAWWAANILPVGPRFVAVVLVDVVGDVDGVVSLVGAVVVHSVVVVCPSFRSFRWRRPHPRS